MIDGSRAESFQRTCSPLSTHGRVFCRGFRSHSQSAGHSLPHQSDHRDSPLMKEPSTSSRAPRSLGSIPSLHPQHPSLSALAPWHPTAEPINAGDILGAGASSTGPGSGKLLGLAGRKRAERALRSARSCNIDRHSTRVNEPNRSSKTNFFDLSGNKQAAQHNPPQYPKSSSDKGRVEAPAEWSGPVTLWHRPRYVLEGTAASDKAPPGTQIQGSSEIDTPPRLRRGCSRSAPLDVALAAKYLPCSESPLLSRHCSAISRLEASTPVLRAESPPPLPFKRVATETCPTIPSTVAEAPEISVPWRAQVVDGKALLAQVSPRGAVSVHGFGCCRVEGNSGVFSLPPPPLGDSVAVVEAPFLFRKHKWSGNKAQNDLLDRLYGKE